MKGSIMPTNSFHELQEDKKQKIIDICISEFAEYGYHNSSTNRIVARAGISKGSLFKYFPGKEELYFYTLDCAAGDLTTSLKEKDGELPADLFDRVIRYAEYEFEWYMKNPDKYKFIMKAFAKDDTEICQKTEARYHLEGETAYYDILEHADTSSLKYSWQKTAALLKWFLQGFNAEFIRNTNVMDTNKMEDLKKDYINNLTGYMLMLKTGLLQ